jgi:hypothetical protein
VALQAGRRAAGQIVGVIYELSPPATTFGSGLVVFGGLLGYRAIDRH